MSSGGKKFYQDVCFKYQKLGYHTSRCPNSEVEGGSEEQRQWEESNSSYSKFGNSGNRQRNRQVICYGCNKPGHYRPDCPEHKSSLPAEKTEDAANKIKEKSIKALAVDLDTWEQYSTAGSETQTVTAKMLNS